MSLRVACRCRTLPGLDLILKRIASELMRDYPLTLTSWITQSFLSRR